MGGCGCFVCFDGVVSGVDVRPDQVSVGVLVTVVPRDAVDGAVVQCGVGAKRSDGKLPPHVTAYLTMGLWLFPDDDYAEVAAKVTGALDRFGCWDAGWSAPTPGGISQARKRLGRDLLAEVFERVAGPVASEFTSGVSCLAFSGQARLWLNHAASCRFSNSSRTCRGVMYASFEWRLREL